MPTLCACCMVRGRSGNSKDAQAFLGHAVTKRRDGVLRRRTGAEADNHAVFNQLRGSFAGLFLQLILFEIFPRRELWSQKRRSPS